MEASPYRDLKSGHGREDHKTCPALVCRLEEGGRRRKAKANCGTVSLEAAQRKTGVV